MVKPDVAVVQGIRIATHPILKKLDEYTYSRKDAPVELSLDNNLMRTKIIRQLGGFPDKCPICVVLQLANVISTTNYHWIVDKSVVSQHLRTNLKKYYKNVYHQYAACKCNKSNLRLNIRLFLTSPLRAIHIAGTQKCMQLLFVYPRIRLSCLQGASDKR
jgi:hypothetical protein